MCKMLLKLAVLTVVSFLGAGCYTRPFTCRIETVPSGAAILLNEKPSGKITPAQISPLNLSSGVYDITLQKDGFITLNDPKKIVVGKYGITICVKPGDSIFQKGAPLNPKIMAMAHKGGAEVYLTTRPEPTIRYHLKPDTHADASETNSIHAINTVPARLKKLKELKDSEAITESEYESQRKVLVEKL